MSDVFISYANEDRDTAEQVAHALEAAGYSVWWDRRIPAGRTWRSVLEEALVEMRCLIVLWSENSVNSPWVLEEAEEARRLGKSLFPVLIQQIDPPVGFRAIQAANLVDWDGAADAPVVKLLVADLKALLGETKARTNGNTGQVRAHPAESNETSVLDRLRRSLGRRWKTLVGGGAAIAVLLGVLQFSLPARNAGDAPPPKPVSEPIPEPPPARQLTAIAILGLPRQLKPADTVVLKVQGSYSDGSQNDIADSVKWKSSDSRVAAVDGQGKLKALHPGTTEVSARHGELVSAPWTVAVTSPQKVVGEIPAIKLVQVAITAPRRELLTNDRFALRVQGRYSDKSEKPIHQDLRWQLSDPSVASITPEGLLSGLRPGRISVSVRAGEVVSAPVAITVREPAKKVSVEIPPVGKIVTETKAVAPVPVEPTKARLATSITRARNLREQGQYAAALAELQKAAAIDPTNAEVTREIEQTRKACAAEVSLGQKIDC